MARITSHRRMYESARTEQSTFENLPADQIRCPVCWGLFPFEQFTIDHVPPSAVAELVEEPTVRVLTCARCNNQMGSNYQNDLKKLVEFELFLTGRQPYAFQKWEVSIDDSDPIRVESHWTADKIELIGVPAANNPDIVQGQVEQLKDLNDEQRILISGRFHVPERAARAIVLSAYLYFIAKVGYKYCYTRAGQELREMINNGSFLGPSSYCVRPALAPVFGPQWMAVLNHPQRFEAMWIKICGRIVILPLPNDGTGVFESYWSDANSELPFAFGLRPKLGEVSLNFGSQRDADLARSVVPMVSEDRTD